MPTHLTTTDVFGSASHSHPHQRLFNVVVGACNTFVTIPTLQFCKDYLQPAISSPAACPCPSHRLPCGLPTTPLCQEQPGAPVAAGGEVSLGSALWTWHDAAQADEASGYMYMLCDFRSLSNGVSMQRSFFVVQPLHVSSVYVARLALAPKRSRSQTRQSSPPMPSSLRSDLYGAIRAYKLLYGDRAAWTPTN